MPLVRKMESVNLKSQIIREYLHSSPFLKADETFLSLRNQDENLLGESQRFVLFTV